MADYYPLLARALDGMAEPGPEARETVYERARTALRSQLGSIVPPLGEAEIARELASLEEAIARVEPTYGAARSEHGTPSEIASPARADPPEPRGERPPHIRRGGRRSRSVLTAVGLVVVIAPIAVAAWLWRDQPTAPPPVMQPVTAPPPTPTGDPKRPERMGGGPVPAIDPVTTPARPPAAPPVAPPSSDPTAPAAPPTAGGPSAPPATAPSSQPEVAVAQRAALFEENQADPQQPKVTAGRTLWRLDVLNAGQGQPLETVVRAVVDLPEANLSLQLVMRRNRDAALPASHTMELNFSTAKSGEGARVVRDVEPPRLRGDDAGAGIRLSALSVPVKENVFLIGLSDLRPDIDRNTDLLLRRNWLELPLRFNSGLRATLIFEKGVSGERVIADAFKQWVQP
ncbi:histidine kinase [uncultured Enterovirga sp.]|uniref:histidine kinase n=1 Tax=uncultured Enterovirga sp. TaxID=2026352 RepID=UPI0035CB0E8B